MPLDDRVSPRRIHDTQLLQQPDRGGQDVQWILRRARRGLTIAQDIHLGRGGYLPLLKHCLSQERIDKGALTGVKLADHHQQKEIVQLLDRFGQGLLILGRSAECGQQDPQITQ